MMEYIEEKVVLTTIHASKVAQPAVTAANAYGRLSCETCQNAFRLYMGRAAVTRERYKDTHLLARIHGKIKQ